MHVHLLAWDGVGTIPSCTCFTCAHMQGLGCSGRLSFCFLANVQGWTVQGWTVSLSIRCPLVVSTSHSCFKFGNTLLYWDSIMMNPVRMIYISAQGSLQFWYFFGESDTVHSCLMWQYCNLNRSSLDTHHAFYWILLQRTFSYVSAVAVWAILCI